MNEYVSPQEQIASDEYWGKLNEMPKVAFSHLFVDVLASAGCTRLGGTIVQTLYTKASRGNLSTSLEVGEPLPLLERGQGLIKVVEDIRKTSLAGSRLLSLFQKNAQDDEPDVFDTKAQAMIANHLYPGEFARMTFTGNSPGESMKILRGVYYLTGSSSRSQLEGITSNMIFLPPSKLPMNLLLPPLVVGESYKRNKAGTLASKIVSAEVLVRGAKRKRTPKKVRATSFSPSYGFSS